MSTRNERIQKNSRNRREQQKQDVREAIIEAAEALFLEKGYEGFSIRQIAERIGYSPGTIYLYFKDKDDVLFNIADEGFSEFGKSLEAACATSDHPMEQIKAMGYAYYAFGTENPAYYQLMFMQRPEFWSRETRDDTQNNETFLILQRTVEQAIQQGYIRAGDPVSTSDGIWAVLHGVVALAILMPIFDEDRPKKALEVAIEMCMNGLKS